MSRVIRYGTAALLAGMLTALSGCESAGYGVGVSYSSGYYGGYHPGYYPGYPGYWYDDDRPVVIVPPGDRPEHHERPTTLPAPAPDRPSLPPARPPSSRPTPMPSTRPATRPMPAPRPMPRRR